MKTRIPQQERSKETKAKIMEAALRLFAAKGYYNTNSKEIAAEAGIAVGSFYAYYQDKKDLFLDVILRLYDEIDLSEKITGLLNSDPRKIIAELIKAAFNVHDFYPEIHREALTMSLIDEDVRQAFEKYDRKIIGDLKEIIEKLNIRVSDAGAAAVIIYSMVENVIHRSRFSDIGISEDKITQALIDLIYEYLFHNIHQE